MYVAATGALIKHAATLNEHVMALSDTTKQLLRAYESFSIVAGGPTLPWIIDTYDDLDDTTAVIMLRSLCYVWAASQRAAGYYDGSVEHLSYSLFVTLPTWRANESREHHVAWLQHLGLRSLLPTPGRTAPPVSQTYADQQNDLITHIQALFDVSPEHAALIQQLGHALSSNTLSLPSSKHGTASRIEQNL